MARPTRTTLCIVALMSHATLQVTPVMAAESLAGTDKPETVARNDAVRTLHHADGAIRRALLVLGQPINPIHVVGPEEIRAIYRERGIDPPNGLVAFRSPIDPTDPTIYVNRASHVYDRASSKPSRLALLKLAATLVHEQVHNSDKEMAAYRLQADFVTSRLDDLPRRGKQDALRYLAELEARARAFAWVDWRRREMERHD